MNFDNIKHVHFLGIGGIGMSALARFFKLQGKVVSGYDRTNTNLTDALASEGIHVYFEEGSAMIPHHIKNDPNAEENLIIYTPAIPEEHAELSYFKEKRCTLLKRAEILGMISKTLPTAAIAGTHGKTTTTSILTFLCLHAKKSFVSFVGGINENFNSNLVYTGEPEFMICEADEYDRSFLQLSPSCSVITSVDADHLDIYGSSESMKESFVEFANTTVKNGLVLVNKKVSFAFGDNRKTYGLTNEADYYAHNVRFEKGRFKFDFKGPKISIEQLELTVPGFHNLENTIAAIVLAIELGVSIDSISPALKKYKGVKRRFEYHQVKDGMLFIDDYAHHPEEINAVVTSLRKMYPGRKITGVFQPHLFSRTKDFADDFAKSLSKLDKLILLDIYPAREKPIDGINSRWLLDKVQLRKKELCTSESLIDSLQKSQPDILVTMGAGDIDKMIPRIAKHFAT